MSGVSRGASIAVVLLLVGCTQPGGSTRMGCVSDALDYPGVTDGVAVFTSENGGVEEVSAGLFNRRDGNTVVDMASLTKPLVAAEVRRRIEAGEWHLQDQVAVMLPHYRLAPESGAITLQQLVQHRAGFDRGRRDPLFDPAPPSCRRAAAAVLARAPELAVGQQMLYSNVGYCILGELLLMHPSGLAPELRHALAAPLGGAGGWRGSLRQLHGALSGSFPLEEMDGLPSLPDGSHYAYAWRSWPQSTGGPRWTHFGRLPGMLSVAVTDGRGSLLVAHLLGDPPDVDAAAMGLGNDLWRCMVQEANPAVGPDKRHQQPN